ncbi:M15 family metallopeptidase [candidate division KSB1 bacterium]|nr:M15 family metallopeptidase [candidate division KSB1 bacterium]
MTISRLILFFALLLLFCKNDRQAGFIDITRLDSTFVIDVRYATENNFTGEAVYPLAKVALRQTPAESLVAVQRELKSMGLGLKVFDGYRPLSVQKRFWEILPDSRYVADPKIGSRHNRGAAVDVTLVDSTGKELELPTEFDDFSERAHSNAEDCSAIARTNRELLKRVMENHGFKQLKTEWWHFDFTGWESFEIVDIPLDKIR